MTTLNIGVFMPNGAQLLDMAAVDLFGVMDKSYLEAVQAMLPDEALWAVAPITKFHYITTRAVGSHIQLTSGVSLKTTSFYDEETVAPGRLDVVVVPGPDPASTYEQGALDWLRRHAETSGVDILSICTGLYVCAAAGVADGKKASGPRTSQADLNSKFPNIKLVGDRYRWVQDGNFWSSGHVTNGNDMVAAYARASPRWESPLVEFGLSVIGTGDRPQLYE
ncbi:DJ-1/PfpI family [Geosmithia morbida]|uniref:DJ-1/PfpI family n=1 Tax=Geosmithia morbida TaxID=1094350 RepID=A0A9P4YWP0_9HYPO|nr:DJ-1/PfpI family [Geosmithia morbida]KAF4122414.1 DJ-1/PfpI family [Geosmithia morbida]